MASHYPVRQARKDELETLVSIDDDAGKLFSQAGLTIQLSENHPFVIDEIRRWAKAIDDGLAYVAVDEEDCPVGFITYRYVDQKPYVDQIAVRTDYMQRGIGAMLLHEAISWSGDQSLWLTTYAHLAWNQPFYAKQGFIPVSVDACGPELLAILEEQKAVLPEPHHRVAMVRY